jgi:hypothetical protein
MAQRYPDDYIEWVYVDPMGLEFHTSHYFRAGEEATAAAPPLPKLDPRRCYCRKEHVCASCGTPFWNEVHGLADGVCTFCYRRG